MADALPPGATLVDAVAAADITPRFDLYTTGEDHLRVMAVNSLAGVVLTIAGRSWDPIRRSIVPLTRTMTPAADRTTSELIIPLAAGFLLDLTVFAGTGTPVSGQVYVMVQLVRGLTSNAPQLAMLASDYVTSQQCVCWPGSQPKSSTSGEPYVRTITGTTPAAGAEITETVPTGARWELVAVRTLFTPDANVATRLFTLHLGGAVNLFASINQLNSLGVGQPRTLTWAANVQAIADVGTVFFQAPLPAPTYLLAAERFSTNTKSIQAGDQYTAVVYQVREWLEVP